MSILVTENTLMVSMLQVRGLYRGATPSFVGMAFESSLLFGFYSQMKQSLQVPKVSLYLVHISGLYMGTNLLELQWASSLAKLSLISLSAYSSFYICIYIYIYIELPSIDKGKFSCVFFVKGEVHSSRPQLQVIIPSAACGGAIISFVLCPSELVKCRMQLQGTDTAITKYERYVGPLDCALKTLKSGGIKGIFRGGFTTLLRESIGNAVFFSTYEFSRHYLHLRLESTSRYLNPESKLLIDVGVGIVTGGLAGMAVSSVAT
eukprot:TRINITY_DN12050_c0_g1_i4.p1 TRINITY_DN12050_c0_g1~~TRINITY_DN12050_c0_g1_i4.p1  ORF type:complete len:262 (-),score=27.40 TRINITY_DN12050_c0_g1_i4:1337-2122(-)